MPAIGSTLYDMGKPSCANLLGASVPLGIADQAAVLSCNCLCLRTSEDCRATDQAAASCKFVPPYILGLLSSWLSSCFLQLLFMPPHLEKLPSCQSSIFIMWLFVPLYLWGLLSSWSSSCALQLFFLRTSGDCQATDWAAASCDYLYLCTLGDCQHLIEQLCPATICVSVPLRIDCSSSCVLKLSCLCTSEDCHSLAIVVCFLFASVSLLLVQFFDVKEFIHPSQAVFDKGEKKIMWSHAIISLSKLQAGMVQFP